MEADVVCLIVQIIEQGLMSKEDYEEVKNRALALFQFGQVQCESYIFASTWWNIVYSKLLNTKSCYFSFISHRRWPSSMGCY
jgi:hypothetical protein